MEKRERILEVINEKMNSKILGVALFLLGLLALIMFLLLKEYNITAPVFIIGLSTLVFFSDKLLKK